MIEPTVSNVQKPSSVNGVTETDDANTIHLESPQEVHTIGEVLLSQSKEKELNANINEVEQWKSGEVYTKIEDEDKNAYLFVG